MSISNDTFIAKLRETGLEDEFLKKSGLSSLDEFNPANFPELKTATEAKSVPKQVTSATPAHAPELSKVAADAKTGSVPEQASDILNPYIGIHINYASRKKLSYYWPSALMMDYIVHLLNGHLVDHFYFKRYCPDYHPYVFRLYCAIVFYIQCLRAMFDVKALPDDQHQFLVHFLEAFPPARLPIPGPLLAYFKTLCSSQPEILQYGKVHPRIPSAPGPARRSDFRTDNATSIVQPNVPGIFALLEDLDQNINGTTPVYPKKGKHIPVNGNARTFGHHSFPADATRSPADKWSLSSSGLQYPCEADAKLNEGFAERYENFDFPATSGTDDLRVLSRYLGMDVNKSWFSQVRDVADAISAYCLGSGTLADCSPTGIVSNQIQIQYLAPNPLPSPPQQIADKRSLFPFSFKMKTTMRNPPALAEALAAFAQTNIRIFPTHPYLSHFGDSNHRTGEFWNARPIESSDSDHETYLSLNEIIRKMIKARVWSHLSVFLFVQKDTQKFRFLNSWRLVTNR